MKSLVVVTEARKDESSPNDDVISKWTLLSGFQDWNKKDLSYCMVLFMNCKKLGLQDSFHSQLILTLM